MAIGHDIGLFNVGEGKLPDLVIENGDLKGELGLETAVLISLFSDKKVELQDLPEGETSRRGWWADLVSEPSGDKIGSLIWTFDRSKNTQEAANRIEDFIKDALRWLIEDGIAETVDVVSEIFSNERIDFGTTITRPDEENLFFKFVWDGQQLKVSEV